MKLIPYLHEIFDIANLNDMPWDVGIDMFLANIRNAGDEDLPYYEGAEHIDYIAIKPILEAMTNEEVADAYNEFSDHVRENLAVIAKERKARKEALAK